LKWFVKSFATKESERRIRIPAIFDTPICLDLPDTVRRNTSGLDANMAGRVVSLALTPVEERERNDAKINIDTATATVCQNSL
jgi:hypothetical protein